MADLGNLRIPPGALRVEIDDPHDRSLGKPVGIIRGWFATRDLDFPEEFQFQIGGIILPHDVVRREDVEAAMPDYSIMGFTVEYDLSSYLPYVQDNRLVIHLTLPGYDPYLMRFNVDDSALAICLAEAGGV
jgi:hypothetical protein